MREMLFFGISFFLVFIPSVFSTCSISNPCCCANQCWISGTCCKKGTPDEYWSPTGCFDFNVWVEPNNIKLTVGKKIPINLYIENTEEYTDRYNISYWIESTNPSLISVDLTGITPTEYVSPREIKVLHPRITVLSLSASGTVWFNVTSWGNSSLRKTASLSIEESDLPLSLEELNFFKFFILIPFCVMIFSIKKY